MSVPRGSGVGMTPTRGVTTCRFLQAGNVVISLWGYLETCRRMSPKCSDPPCGGQAHPVGTSLVGVRPTPSVHRLWGSGPPTRISLVSG